MHSTSQKPQGLLHLFNISSPERLWKMNLKKWSMILGVPEPVKIFHRLKVFSSNINHALLILRYNFIMTVIIYSIFTSYFFTLLVYRKAARHAVKMTSFAVTTTSASHKSGCVMAKKIVRWEKMRKTAREQVQH